MDNTRIERVLHKCDFCDYETSKKNYLAKHIKTVHFFERPFKCDLCDFSSATKLGFPVDYPTPDRQLILFSLMKSVLSNLIEIRTKSGFNKHIARVHVKRRDFKCPLCEHTTTDKEYLRTHIKTHETEETCTKRYQCDFCGKKFHHRSKLRIGAYSKPLTHNL